MRAARTLRGEVTIEGVGIHTGRPARLVCRPAAPGTGAVLSRTDVPGRPSWVLNRGRDAAAGLRAEGNSRRTVLSGPDGSVETVEHFLAALWALGVMNVAADLSGPELPILDGSALEYVRALESAGLADQPGHIPELTIQEPIFVSRGQSAILALPHPELRVTYTLDYPYPGLSGQTVSLDLTPEVFLSDVAPCRTFCARDEVDRLRGQGFGKGATTENTLVMTAEGPLGNRLRFKDECARHKILDLIGDLSLLGADVRAHIIAVRSGHALNQQMRDALAVQSSSGDAPVRER